MALKQTTLRPGLLVRFNTAIRAIRSERPRSSRRCTSPTPARPRSASRSTSALRTQTNRLRPSRIRSKMRALVCSACVQTEFNLFCPEDRADKLEKRIEEAGALAGEFNSRARITRIDVSYITAKIDSDDVLAMREIRVEASRLIDEITGRMKGAGLGEEGIEATRDALKKAKRLGRMLSPEAQASLEGTVQMAREALSEIKKVGEANAAEDTKRAIAALEQQRLAFLDLDGEGQIEAPTVNGRTVDLVSEEPTKKPATKKPTKKAA